MCKELRVEKLLSPQEVADSLSLSVGTIYRWIENGTLPAIKVGKRTVRVSEKSLKSWLEKRPYPSDASRDC